VCAPPRASDSACPPAERAGLASPPPVPMPDSTASTSPFLALPRTNLPKSSMPASVTRPRPPPRSRPYVLPFRPVWTTGCGPAPTSWSSTTPTSTVYTDSWTPTPPSCPSDCSTPLTTAKLPSTPLTTSWPSVVPLPRPTTSPLELPDHALRTASTVDDVVFTSSGFVRYGCPPPARGAGSTTTPTVRKVSTACACIETAQDVIWWGYACSAWICVDRSRTFSVIPSRMR